MGDSGDREELLAQKELGCHVILPISSATQDLDVSIAEDLLTITGEKKADEITEEKDFYYEERSFGAFIRKLRLPIETETTKASATFQDGVLEIRIPKSPVAKEKVKKLEIK